MTGCGRGPSPTLRAGELVVGHYATPSLSSPFPLLLARLKTVLKCHVPDPSEFFSQLSSQHGGDLQVGAWGAGVGVLIGSLRIGCRAEM